MAEKVSFNTALKKILKSIRPLPHETVCLENALGLVLSEDVAADRDIPPFNRSAMDGYAVVASDTQPAPARLKIIGEVVPGEEPVSAVSKGQAMRIMTGAPLPDGADAVQKVEVCGEEGGFVEIGESVVPGENVAPRSEDADAGDVILSAGSIVTPGVISLLASVGKLEVSVRRPPRVALAVTGNEVVAAWESPSAVQIRNANGLAIAARCRQAGAEIKDLGIVGDEKKAIAGAIEDSRTADALILTGGVSMGRYDFVKDVLKEAGAEILFEKVAMKPGKPTAFALVEGRPVFALPGNPVSCLVATELFVVPALRSMIGIDEAQPLTLRAELKGEVRGARKRTAFVPARLAWRYGIPQVSPLPYHGSGDFVDFAAAGALVIVPPEEDGYDSAAIVDIIPLEGGSWRSG